MRTGSRRGFWWANERLGGLVGRERRIAVDAQAMAVIISRVAKGGNLSKRNWRRQWLLRRARKYFLRPRVVAGRQRHVAMPRGEIISFPPRGTTTALDKAIEIELPPCLDFEENYETTVNRLRQLRDSSYGLFRVKKLKFDNLLFISPAAALVLASEVDQWKQRLGSGRLRADVDSWDGEVKRRLFEMGYFELLDLDLPPMAGQQNDVTFLKFLRGESGEKVDPGTLAKNLRINIEAIVGQGINKHFLFEGLSEAITNVSQHAYPASMPNIRKKQWWLSASFDRQTRNLQVMFYDQGVGIPKTLHTSHLWEGIKEFFGGWTDARKIKAAMEYGRSSTERPERGKGLKNLVEFAKVHEAGRLSIYSERGLYRILHTRDNELRTIGRNHKESIGGTLIEWSVKL